MKNLFPSIMAISVSTLLLVAGCKKTTVWSVPDPVLYKKVKSVITSSGSGQTYQLYKTVNYTYDSQGRIQTQETINPDRRTMSTFSYTQNTVTISDSGGNITIDTLNSQGYLMGAAGGSRQYDANGYLIYSDPGPSAIGFSAVRFTISHGDVIETKSEYNSVYSYLNKVDYRDFGQPYLGKRNVHLESAITTTGPGGTNPYTSSITYTFDAQGSVLTSTDSYGYVNIYSYY
jgi:hypothetical protein